MLCAFVDVVYMYVVDLSRKLQIECISILYVCMYVCYKLEVWICHIPLCVCQNEFRSLNGMSTLCFQMIQFFFSSISGTRQDLNRINTFISVCRNVSCPKYTFSATLILLHAVDNSIHIRVYTSNIIAINSNWEPSSLQHLWLNSLSSLS